mmetsp:Transcript_34675/g.53131  ORF Transcript_34675/g.53131 Transcript_34675/m.53131 type:complete len:101 (+) Transcript_34675:1875-2177(+)
MASQVVVVERLKLRSKIMVRNNSGKYSDGKKVTGVEFCHPHIAMVTTNDSRVRFVNIMDGSIIMKVKGHTNTQFHVRASLSPDLNHVICGSENGDVYLWS